MSDGMPNYETKARRLEGHGPPLVDEGFIGDRYTDLDSGELWAKRKTGWTNRTQAVIHPTIRQKGAWCRAADEQKQNLETWVCEKLDAAANENL